MGGSCFKMLKAHVKTQVPKTTCVKRAHAAKTQRLKGLARLARFEFFGLVGCDERVDHLVEVAVEKSLKLV